MNDHKPRVQIDENIRPYLNEIAERLWSTPSHATIMVGSGFSKNANKNFPDWNKLGDLFFEKIHGRIPDKNNGEDRYLNPLKLADEVQSAFGRPALDKLLLSSIPDDDSEPSSLHIKLLEFPWSDIFTTNYDTLLDRACNSVSSQKFDIVVNKEDLINSEKPRIIKLHGSFPSKRPFIITEEDYRTYPIKFAPFVNTVQQSLLENTLCLIGFSGDDPNFLQWIGWIRDNLGKENSPKMYLIGIINLSEAQKKLLEQRNIVLVDFSKCSGIGGSHYKALELFFEYLSSCRKKDSRLGWPENLDKMHPDIKLDKILVLKEIIEEWRQTRLSYPGWIVVPEDKRETLWVFTNGWVNYVTTKDKLPDLIDLQFLFELNWRLERSLCPLLTNIVELIEMVIDKYWPFKETSPKYSTICYSDKKYKDLDWEETRNMGLNLFLSMLRFYREEGMFEKWEETNTKLNDLIMYLPQDKRAFLHYERVLCALFKLEMPKVKLELNSWPTNFSIPFWEAKRAGLLAEIGEVEKAEQILERSLQEIRSKLNLKPITTNFSLVSEEASTMILLQYVRGSTNLRNNNLEKQAEYRHKFSKRWDTLKQYKCDPWNEIKMFDNQLKRSPIEQIPITENYEFEIGRITMTHHMHGWDEEALIAYGFLRYFEESGYPFRLPGSYLSNKSPEGALRRLTKHSPYWAMVTLIRNGDAKVADRIFNRQAVLRYSVSDIDRMIDSFLETLKLVEPDIADGDGFNVDNFGVLLAHILPEILSRLCCKCSPNKRLLLLDFLSKTYNSEYKNNYRGINNLLRRLMESFSVVERYKLIPDFLEISFPENISPITNHEYVNPFIFINIEKDDLYSTNKINLKQDKIEILFDLASSNIELKRKWGTFSLIQLYAIDLLTDKQARKLGTILWSKTDNQNFPLGTDYYKFAFLNLPHPKEIDPIVLIKNYIKITDFPIHSNKKNNSMRITGGKIPFCTEIIGANRSITWTEKELSELLNRLIEWWDSDKSLLMEEITSPSSGEKIQELKSRFRNLIDVLVEIILSTLKGNSTHNEYRDIIKRLIKELDEYGIPSIRVKAAGLPFLQLKKGILCVEFEDMLSSEEHEEVVDGLNALLLLFQTDSPSKNDIIKKILVQVGQKIRWQHRTGLVSALNTIVNILRKHREFYSAELETMCLLGLKKMVTETSLDIDTTEANFFRRLELRKIAAFLASNLNDYYIRKDMIIPAEVLLWENICSSQDEFAEIKVQWREGS